MGKWTKRLMKAIRAGESVRKTRPDFLLVEALESRVLLSVDLFIGSASTGQFSGIPGDSVSLTMSDIGNNGNDYVYTFEADADWYLSIDNNPYGTNYPLWSGNTPWGLDGFTSGGSFTETGTIPNVAPGQYYLVAMLNGDALPAETDWTNNYIVFDTPVTIYSADDHGDSASFATSIPKNTWIDGNIEVEFDVDAFSFTAIAGKRYTLETSTGTLFDTFLTLRDQNGSTILASDLNSGTNQASRIEWIAPSNGTFYAFVSNNILGIDIDSIGTYSLS